MRTNLMSIATVACAAVLAVHAERPSVDFSGFLDADVWADLKGSYYTNTELDLGMSLKFTDNVSAHVYATVNNCYSESGSGWVPAGTGDPSERWLDMKFDGFDITYASKLGTFTVGDIVYQYGKFNYYAYKRFSMITNENFSRGIKYGIGSDLVETELQAGVADVNSSVGDVQGMTKVKFTDDQSAAVFYGIRGSSVEELKTSGEVFAGLEYNGAFGDIAKVKFDFGFRSLPAIDPSEDRSSLMTLLLEPTLTFGKFSVAMTGFAMIDPDTINTITEPLYSKVADEWFVYVEPGITFNDYIGAGLPIEFHGREMDVKKDEEFWLVPTLYVYPTSNVQWWIWGQMISYVAEDSDVAWGLGSEVIVTF